MRVPTAAAVVACVALAAPATASAAWNITQSQAERYTRQATYQEYGVNRYDMSTLCVPKGRSQTDQYDWRSVGAIHSWICGWSHGDCGGVLSVKGTTSYTYAFRYYVLRGLRC